MQRVEDAQMLARIERTRTLNIRSDAFTSYWLFD